MDSYSHITKLYGMENIFTEEFMNKLDMFQARFGKVDESGWWDMDRIQTEYGMHFTSREFQEGLSMRELRLSLAAPEHQEINVQVEVTWRTLRTILH